MAESDLRREFIKLTALLDPHPIENLLPSEKGMPDVEYIGGMCELKWLPKWPVRDTTPVRIPHYSAEQKHWLKRRCDMGGKAWLCLQVRSEWFLFWGATVAQNVGELTYEQLRALANFYWANKPTYTELVYALTSLPV